MTPMKNMRTNRRQALAAGLSALGGAALLPRGVAAQPLLGSFDESIDLGDRILVLVRMYGGNDGLNTICPFEDDTYHNARPDLRLKPEEVLRIDDQRGFHPELSSLHDLWNSGEMAIVEGVGYPKPVLSHFKSFDIWDSASRTGVSPDGDGWIGRLRRLAWGGDRRSEVVMHVGSHVPHSIYSKTHPALTFEAAESYVWVGDPNARKAYLEGGEQAPEKLPKGRGQDDVLARLRGTLKAAQTTSPRIIQAVSEYQPTIAYPRGDEFAQNMKVIAALINRGFDTRVYSVSIGNYDQHGPQRKAHDPLLRSLDLGVSCLLRDLRETSFGKKVLVVAFSEFGRRVEQNASSGTDHGAAGPMFLFGQPVNGGLYGQMPSTTDLDADGNLKYSTDFRSVYTTVAEDWFGVNGEALIGQAWPKLPLLNA